MREREREREREKIKIVAKPLASERSKCHKNRR